MLIQRQSGDQKIVGLFFACNTELLKSTKDLAMQFVYIFDCKINIVVLFYSHAVTTLSNGTNFLIFDQVTDF